MLKTLHVQNFAIVESLELEFDSGMTVLTGETGAGKSILLDALGLALGDRADSSVVRHDAERAEVTAAFALPAGSPVLDWLNSREMDADDECIVRRTVSADGRSRGYINGQTVPVQLLKELGEMLVDIHGQHAHQSLLRRDVQRQLLDDYANHGELLGEVSSAFRGWHALAEEFAGLARAREERDSRLELLRYQVGELQALELGANEVAELDEEHARLANASRLLEGAQRAATVLYDGEDLTVVTLLQRTQHELLELQGYDSGLASTCQLLEGAVIQAQEAASEIRHYLDRLELDPGRLQWVEERLASILSLARKHRVEPAELPAVQQTLEAELERLEGADARLDHLEADIARARDGYLELARRLSEQRRKAAAELAEQISHHMQELAMKGGQFAVVLEPLAEDQAGPLGMERVEFQVTANPGQPLRPLAKVASGGEISRISLAIQVVSAGLGGTPTLIFDEVDVGIGGGTAEIVGRRLRSLGLGKQVLCVTHQPQVAALGHHHLQIRKQTHKGSTSTEVVQLPTEERISEIARMLGGLEITEQTQAHAREMLLRATG